MFNLKKEIDVKHTKINLNRNTEESLGRHCEIGFGLRITLKMSHLQFWLFFFMYLQQDSLVRNSVTLRLWLAFQNPGDKHIKIHVQLKTSLLVGVYILQESFTTTAVINSHSQWANADCWAAANCFTRGDKTQKQIQQAGQVRSKDSLLISPLGLHKPTESDKLAIEKSAGRLNLSTIIAISIAQRQVKEPAK